MSYTGTPSQKSRLAKALRQLKDRKITDRKVVEAIARWKKHLASGEEAGSASYLSRIPLSESAYSSYRRGQRQPDFERAKLIYDFLESGYDPDVQIDTINQFSIDVSTDDGALVHKTLAFLNSEDASFRYEDISSLCGVYAMYRRLWIKNSDDYVICSKFTIEEFDGIFRMSEEQDYSFHGKHINEYDRGFVYPYSTNFFALSRSDACLKFYIIHEMYPPLRRGSKAEELLGAMTGVAASGPHPSFKFFLSTSPRCCGNGRD